MIVFVRRHPGGPAIIPPAPIGIARNFLARDSVYA